MRCRHLLVAAILAAPVTLAAEAKPVYVDAANPTGVPDLSQWRQPWCAAAAGANAMWNWSAYRPFDGSVDDGSIVAHTNPANFATNWYVNSSNVTMRLATLIYAEINGLLGTVNGYGTTGGYTKYLNEKKHLYGWWSNADGLSVRFYSGNKATYARMKTFLEGGAEVVSHWAWHLPDGTWVENDDEKSRHSITISGWDTADACLYLSNPWGDHRAGPPVSTAWYDHYPITVTGAGVVRIHASDNPNAPENRLVRGITNADESDYVQMYAFDVIKRGGSPRVRTDVTENADGRRFEYLLWNAHDPEDGEVPQPVHHFQLEVPEDFITIDDILPTIELPDGWSVEPWNPADDVERYGPTINCGAGSSCGYAWAPAWRGLHFFTTTAPLGPDEQTTFAFTTPLDVPYAAEGVGLTVVGEADRDVLYFNMAGGPLRNIPACIADLDGTLIVDAQDLAILLATWGRTDVDADLDGDGTVDAADLAILIGEWGPCPIFADPDARP